jgi:hypothetical protein
MLVSTLEGAALVGCRVLKYFPPEIGNFLFIYAFGAFHNSLLRRKFA